MLLSATSREDAEERHPELTLVGEDYVTKPFSLGEVVERMRRLICRSGTAERHDEAVLIVGDLTLDKASRTTSRSGEFLDLTATEFALLHFLMRNSGRVLSKKQIVDEVWSYDFGGQVDIVELCISSLRRKIDAGREPMVHAQGTAGYLLKPVNNS